MNKNTLATVCVASMIALLVVVSQTGLSQTELDSNPRQDKARQHDSQQEPEPERTESKDSEPAALKAPRVGWSEAAIEIGNTTRWYRVLRPSKFIEGNPAVVLLHGGTQSMRKIFMGKFNASGRWATIAEREGFLLIVPNGTNAATSDTKGDEQNWNDYRPDSGNPETDDVVFIESLLDGLQVATQFDNDRVYVTGASNGGMMTFRMLVERPNLFAAGASFIASLPMDTSKIERPETSTPLFICNGTRDPLIKWQGGEVAPGRGTTCPIEQTVDWWIETNQCNAEPRDVTKLEDKDPKDRCQLVQHIYEPKEGGAPLVFVKILGGGHTLPSIQYSLPDFRLVKRLFGRMCHDIEGAEMAWEFMSSHTR